MVELDSYKRFKKKRLVNVRRALDLFINKVIDEHLAKKRNKNSNDENEAATTDMVDELVIFLDEGDDYENKSTDSLSTFKLNRDNIKGLIMVRAFYHGKAYLVKFSVSLTSLFIINCIGMCMDDKSKIYWLSILLHRI